MANGHGRIWRHAIQDVTPYDLQRWCDQDGETTLLGSADEATDEESCIGGNVTYRWRSATANFKRVP
eukprot:CAMPEP_0202827500 /NCGR_PEP_ID=MMETSP1389-20130828/14316_1 /ASSEMBLY_ACC=CAM_ASM_000865 /TAXON_ID=302021 /ORGANISM="Rhodomonas sp., Strain CCMP768" /LENGTH=66 /DNA_ID=CAMNT_0049500907 /DNA_START=52 /DNA_END=249 /DNA_ORIENTATION=+